eukprot:CAMPEP_0202896554 /NCGR_PEP_ID=MMETSP1392-20130828/5545_1 /ASSEMBLY_ACC=CAM_ASM_000868 /TAXON_ID=225041 /ORGANISM="Chlamydomonas chlamydogama, Strain SAG 11-48b" /LENGTH=87 /DNA_ID=CAMNT_0049581963 /DNA_START=1745 /DNA_END=2005 /DNA_ORIENTATION=+
MATRYPELNCLVGQLLLLLLLLHLLWLRLAHNRLDQAPQEVGCCAHEPPAHGLERPPADEGQGLCTRGVAQRFGQAGGNLIGAPHAG